MFDISDFPQADAVSKAAQLSQADYQRLYRQSIDDPDAFWSEQAKALDWIKPWSQ
ncbi:acetyl-coenzyme A synthetase N-terminal domain-containing protein, partial [Pseudomonas donghuensis]